MSILEEIDNIGAMQPSKCKRYGCERTAATAKGDCLMCDAADRKAAETVAVIERRGHVVMWLILAVLAGFFTHGIYLASRP